MKKDITKDFVDEKGTRSQMIITPANDVAIKLTQSYALQRPSSNNKYMKKGAKGKGTFTSDIGIKSQGFAPIFTLALIISIGAILIAFILWRV